MCHAEITDGASINTTNLFTAMLFRACTAKITVSISESKLNWKPVEQVQTAKKDLNKQRLGINKNQPATKTADGEAKDSALPHSVLGVAVGSVASIAITARTFSSSAYYHIYTGLTYPAMQG